MPTISEQLKAAVLEAVDRGWSIRAIARATGVPQPTISRWLADDRDDIAMPSADKLAAWLGVRLTRHKIPQPKAD